ncbi:MAG: MarR family transcriptional regulator [Acidimicrobiales bacterium]
MAIDTDTPSFEPNVRYELANRLFFRLYQCANILHKTGSRALEDEGLTTQRWAVLGALSRSGVSNGMAIGDLARYLKVSRQSLAGVIGRLESDGLIETIADTNDRRSRLVRMTAEGKERWETRALPRIGAFYDEAVHGLSTEDLSHALHYLVRLLDNMSAIDDRTG